MGKVLTTEGTLGKGGVAEAWLVQDQETGQRFVQKKLRCDPSLSALVENSGRRAYTLLKGLRPLMPRVQMPIEPYSQGLALYEYVPGKTLDVRAIGALPFADRINKVRNLLAKTLDVVFELTSQGLVHCDVRPENIVKTPGGDLHLIDPDFLLGEGEYPRRQLHGPVWYMAPEILRGKPDGKSDLFSVGVTGWTMLGAPLQALPSPMVLKKERAEDGLGSPAGKRLLDELKEKLRSSDLDLHDLLEGLTEKSPMDRPNLSDCLSVLGPQNFRPLDQNSSHS